MGNKSLLLATVAAGLFLLSATTQAHDIVGVGSSAVAPFADAVAANIKADGHGMPEYRSSHTGAGFKSVCAGAGAEFPDIAGASRPIKAEESALCAQNAAGALTELKFGKDAVVIVGEAEHAEEMSQLTSRHMWLAMAAQAPVNGVLVDNPYKNWSDIDPALPAEPIELLVPPEGSGTEEVFDLQIVYPACNADPVMQSLSEAERAEACEARRDDGALIEVEHSEEILEAMDELEHAMGIVGFAGMAAAEGDGDSDDAMLALDGIAPTAATIADGSYKGSRYLYIYVKSAHIDDVEGLREFAAEFVSDRASGADGYLTKLGLVPLSPEERKAAQDAASGLTATN